MDGIPASVPDARIADLGALERLARADRAARAARAGSVEAAAAEFEALLATMLVKEMRAGLSEGFFGQGAGADVFDGWLDQHLGESLARSGVLDLAGIIKAEMEPRP
jgi:Rod binding domain-containing protein